MEEEDTADPRLAPLKEAVEVWERKLTQEGTCSQWTEEAAVLKDVEVRGPEAALLRLGDVSGALGPSGRGHRAASLGVTGTLGPYRSLAGDNEGPYFPSRELSGNFHCYRYSLSPRRYCYEGSGG